MTNTVICPVCGEHAMRSKTRYGDRHECCGMHSWNGAPLATPQTHAARSAAHAAFDAIWKSGRIKRGTAYQLLAEELGLSRADCHMKIMDEETALKVPAAAKRIEEALLCSP